MTALSFSNWIVTAGSSSLTCPALMASITAGGRASESTFSPTDKAVLGLTFLMACCICRVSGPKLFVAERVEPEDGFAVGSTLRLPMRWGRDQDCNRYRNR